MVVIGLAGGIGTGKSEVARILGELGAAVLEADRMGHAVYLPDTDGFREVVATFGDDVVGENGEIDRRVLGSKVFGNPEAMEKLNQIAWPRIKQMLADGIKEQQAAGAQVIVMDAAIMIEAGWTDLSDEVWVTSAPIEHVIQRVQARNNLTEEQIRSRVNSQMSTEERVKHAHAVVENDGGLEDLQNKVKELWQNRLVSKGLVGG